MINIVADVLTVKDSDSRPTLEMSIEDMNSASDQPTSDTQFDGYQASDFEDAERIEFHMDYVRDGEEDLRIVDGREATFDSQNDTVSVDLERADTARQGQYYFEWVLIYDTGVTTLANADEVNSVPDVGFYGLQVTQPTDRQMAAANAPFRTVGSVTWQDSGADPDTNGEMQRNGADLLVYSGGGVRSLSDIGTGSGGSAIILDLGDDGQNETLDLGEIATVNDKNSIATEPSSDKLRLDMAKNWPAADDVPNAAVDHDATANYVATEHIDHNGLTVGSGSGLSGGGDLTADRTLSLDTANANTWTATQTFDATIAAANLAADPTANGEIQRNGTDVKVYSGGAVRNLSNVGSGGGGSGSTSADTATVSGDGSTTTFTLPHTLGETPTAAHVMPTSEDASTDFWVSNKTSSDVNITYAAAPASGTDNLTYDIITQ